VNKVCLDELLLECCVGSGVVCGELFEPVCPVTRSVLYIYLFIGLYRLCGTEEDFAVVFRYDGIAFVFMYGIVSISSIA